VSKNYIEANPLNKFRLPKLPEKINLSISESEFKSIIKKMESEVLNDYFLFAYEWNESF